MDREQSPDRGLPVSMVVEGEDDIMTNQFLQRMSGRLDMNESKR